MARDFWVTIRQNIFIKEHWSVLLDCSFESVLCFFAFGSGKKCKNFVTIFVNIKLSSGNKTFTNLTFFMAATSQIFLDKFERHFSEKKVGFPGLPN